MGLSRLAVRLAPTRVRRARGAQALAELVFVLPLLLIILSAVLHFGLLFYVLIGLHSAVTNASMYASAHPNDNTAILSTIDRSLPIIVDKTTVTKTLITGGTRNFG